MKQLYRPVGLQELKLILDTENRCFPPRLFFQPIFYPVLNEEYATEIAEKWNTKDENSGYCGFVTEFTVDPEYLEKFEVHTVGAFRHQELWVPAEELAEFNKHIQEPVKLVKGYYGAQFHTLNHSEQLLRLAEMKNHGSADYQMEVLKLWKEIHIHYFLWDKRDFTGIGLPEGERDSILLSIRTILKAADRWFLKA